MAKHGRIKDSGAYFVIDPISRRITVPHAHKSIGTVGDHNSEQITFMCPQEIDGHDVSQCARRYVTWINVLGEVGHDELHIVQVEQSAEKMLYLSWTIRNSLTVAKGVISFSVHFEDVDDNDATLYRWSTATCKDCDILDSINAVVGAFEEVYVAGDALVFSNYNPVKDGVLKIETNGLIPKGTLEIKENGKFPVGEYAEVDVAVHTKDDPDFIPENIKKGVNILGVEGAYDPLPLVSGTIKVDRKSANKPVDLQVYYSGCSNESDEIILSNSCTVADSTQFNANFVKDSLIIIKPVQGIGGSPQGGMYIEIDSDAELITQAKDNFMFVIKPKSNNFNITITDDSGAIG